MFSEKNQKLTGKPKSIWYGNPVGNNRNIEPVSTIPQKGSRAEFVTVRKGVPTTEVGKR